MRYLDVDIEIGAGLGRSYPLVVRSAAGDARREMQFPYTELALKDTLKDLRIALLQSSQTHRALTDEEQAVQQFGQQLFEALFAGMAGNLFHASRAKATQEGLFGVRLRLHIQAPDLAGLPWEYLYDPGQDEFLCLSHSTSVVRYPELAEPLQPLQVTPPLRILGMIASPTDQDRLDIKREKARMEEALKTLNTSGQMELTWLSGQTWEDLQEAMWHGPWHIFHFIGHGGYDKRADEGVIAFCDEEGQAHLLGARDLARLLTAHRPLRLVVLNACDGAKGGQRDLFSSTAATLAKRGIPAVLAMQEEITDKAAIQLTRTFYRALANGQPVDAALDDARTAMSVALRHSLEWGTPVLYLRAPDSTLFTLSSTPGSIPIKQEPITQQVPSDLKLPEKSAEQWRKEGYDYYEAQRYQEALPAFERAIEIDPSYVRAHSDRGFTFWQLGRNEEALASFEQAIQLDPNYVSAYIGKGNALRKLNRYGEGLATYDRALQLDGSNGAAYVGKGKALHKLNRHEEALAVFERAIQLAPADAVAQRGKGDSLNSLKRYQEALAAYERALQLQPHYSDAQLGREAALKALQTQARQAKTKEQWVEEGEQHRAAGRNQEALECFEQAIKLDQSHVLAIRGKSMALFNLQRHEEALKAADEAIRLDPNDTAAHYNKGYFLSGLQRYQEALPAFEEAIKRNPTFGGAYTGKGQALTALGRPAEALGALEQAWALNPNDRTTQQALQELARRLPVGTLLLALTGHTDEVYGVAWSPDGRRLASASGDQTVRLWVATSGHPLATLSGHDRVVRAVAWSPDGRRLASASTDQTVRLWDAASGQPLSTLTGHTDAVNAVAWSPDGRRLASVSDDQTARVWWVGEG